MNIVDQIFSIQSVEDFERVALETYHFQKENCSVYNQYVETLGRPDPTKVEEIPFLPISFFKSHKVLCGNKKEQILFKSSGTGGERSKHFVLEPSLYEKSFTAIYHDQIGNPEDQIILALLPNYIEQGESSLIYMVNHLIEKSNSTLSGFFLENHDELISSHNKAISLGKSVVIFGVSYALLDLAERNPDLSKATVIETGGMKGRRVELSKAELHEALKKGFGCSTISSEYGMTELLSQSYSKANGMFDQPAWMKILIRDVNDPFSYVREGKSGGINVIDLANLYSCSFIATQDLGRITGDQFEILGRFDNSDLRGCNMLVE